MSSKPISIGTANFGNIQALEKYLHGCRVPLPRDRQQLQNLTAKNIFPAGSSAYTLCVKYIEEIEEAKRQKNSRRL